MHKLIKQRKGIKYCPEHTGKGYRKYLHVFLEASKSLRLREEMCKARKYSILAEDLFLHPWILEVFHDMEWGCNFSS